MAKDDGNFEKYAYVSDTTSTTYFGGMNVNRGTFALESGAAASPKTEQQKIDTHNALMNKSFRKALAHAWDRATVNATSRGEDLKLTNIRNMYTHPQFVSLENDIKDADGHEFAAGTFYGDMVQYYIDQLGGEITVADAVDGWYNADLAQAYLAKAKEELGDSVTWPITIDITYYSPSESNTAQAQVSKQTIEQTLGAENVVVNLVETTTSADFYACGYRAASGAAGNFDFFYGSGWGPDYGDPSTYLDTFGVNGYMLKVIGVDY
jgi:peptide/nickel transport system substrate-binding protein/oligopeptide transport system substrate-binding protein